MSALELICPWCTSTASARSPRPGDTFYCNRCSIPVAGAGRSKVQMVAIAAAVTSPRVDRSRGNLDLVEQLARRAELRGLA